MNTGSHQVQLPCQALRQIVFKAGSSQKHISQSLEASGSIIAKLESGQIELACTLDCTLDVIGVDVDPDPFSRKRLQKRALARAIRTRKDSEARHARSALLQNGTCTSRLGGWKTSQDLDGAVALLDHKRVAMLFHD